MDTDKLLTGTELYGFLVNNGSPYLEELAAAAEVLGDAGLDEAEIKLAMEFANCIVGLHLYVPFQDCHKDIQVYFLAQDQIKGQITDCLPGPVDGYVIYAKSLQETVRTELMELLDYDRMITQEAYLVARAVCLIRRQLLKTGEVKSIKRSDHLKTLDPALKETIKLFDENFDPMEQIPDVDEQTLKIEFDITVIDNLVIGQIEWGMSLDELVRLVKLEI
jgi:hypothetical protein